MEPGDELEAGTIPMDPSPVIPSEGDVVIGLSAITKVTN
jgi:hypothetical protein